MVPIAASHPRSDGASRNWRQFYKAAALPLGLLVVQGAMPAAHADTELATRIDALIAPLVAAKEFSGAVVLSRKGEIVYQRGFGMANHAAGTAFTPDTPIDGASLAKTFTAAGVAWLVHEGRIELDAPVTRYLPEFPHAETTVRHLLSHSNGLPPYYEFFDPHFTADEVRTTEALLRVVIQQAPTPTFAAGSRFEYSNFGFDLLALIIERITGQSFEAFLGDRFFSRLGMEASFARPARLADWKGVRTIGYRWHENEWQLFDAFDMEAFLGASNLHFSATDLARWANANAARTALPDAVFSAGQKRSMIGGQQSPITGLSWYTDSTGNRGYYTGSYNAFHDFVYWDHSRDESVVFVSNSTLPPWKTIALQLDLVNALAGGTDSQISAPEFVQLTKATRAAVAGIYETDGVGPIAVTAGADGVRIRVGEGLEFDAFPVSSEVFYVPGPDYWIAFSDGVPPATMHLKSMFLKAVLSRTSGLRVAEPSE